MTRASSVLVTCLAAMLTSFAAAEETAPTPAATTSSPTPAEPTSTTTPTAQTTPAAPAEPAADAKTNAAAQPPSAVELAASTADPVICKTVAVTGSRVRKTKTCMPASKWQAAMEAAQKMMKDNDRKSSPQAGGEQLLGR